MFSKRTAVLAAFSTLLSTGAFAADIVSSPEATPVFSWTGAYVGLNAGYGGGSARNDLSVDNTPIGGSGDFRSNGFLGGIQAGYNYQVNQWVIGAEADFQGSGLKADGPIVTGGFGAGAFTVGTKLDWYGTVRARAGVLATDRFLVYATGGLAYGHTKSYFEQVMSGPFGTNTLHVEASKTRAGWTAGAGAEYAITDHVSFKTEYAYTDLGRADGINRELFPGQLVHLDRKVNFHSVKVGINYKF